MREPSDGPTIAAERIDGPLEGRSIDAEVLQGRPASTLDGAAGEGTTCRRVRPGRPVRLYSCLYRV